MHCVAFPYHLAYNAQNALHSNRTVLTIYEQ